MPWLFIAKQNGATGLWSQKKWKSRTWSWLAEHLKQMASWWARANKLLEHCFFTCFSIFNFWEFFAVAMFTKRFWLLTHHFTPCRSLLQGEQVDLRYDFHKQFQRFSVIFDWTRNGGNFHISHSATLAEWLSGCSSDSGRVAEWLSGWVAEWLIGWVADWLLQPLWLSGLVAAPATLAEWQSGWVAAAESSINEMDG